MTENLPKSEDEVVISGSGYAHVLNVHGDFCIGFLNVRTYITWLHDFILITCYRYNGTRLASPPTPLLPAHLLSSSFFFALLTHFFFQTNLSVLETTIEGVIKLSVGYRIIWDGRLTSLQY